MPARSAAVPSPLVVALDVGSSSVRAMAFDARGQRVGRECQLGYEATTTPDGGVEVDPGRLVEMAGQALDGLLEGLGPGPAPIAAVATSTFWHTVLGVGDEGRALTPVYSWADTRSTAAVGRLRERVDEKAYHARTGCPLHTSYLPARLLWLAEREPALASRVRRWLSLGEFLHLVLLGEARASVSMASGTGLFDQNALEWDRPILEALGIPPERLSPVVDLDAPGPGLRPSFAARWPALARARWLPALGDGGCSNIGAGCTGPDRAALMVGTSGAMRVCFPAPAVTIPPGLWCYRVDRRRRLLGGSLSNGGSVYAWLRETLAWSAPGTIEAELAGRPPDGHGLTVLPFLAGERSVGWASHARGAVVGLSLATRPIDILQAGLEAVAYRFALIHARLVEACPTLSTIVATGGALLSSPAWLRIVADVLGVPVTPSTEPEGSSRGAALLALEATGIVPSIEAVPAGLGPPVSPDLDRHQRYREGLRRHLRLYEALLPIYARRSEA